MAVLATARPAAARSDGRPASYDAVRSDGRLRSGGRSAGVVRILGVRSIEELAGQLAPAVRAAVDPIIRQAVTKAMAWRTLARRTAGVQAEWPVAVRSEADRAWVAAQIAKRAAYIRRIAAELDLDPAEAERAWSTGKLRTLLRRGPFAL
jgi:hypothetical protein